MFYPTTILTLLWAYNALAQIEIKLHLQDPYIDDPHDAGCQYTYPSFTGLIYSEMPDTCFTSGPQFVAMSKASNNITSILNEPGAVGAIRSNDRAVDTIIEFSGIPDDAWGCQLETSFAPGRNQVHFLENTPTCLEVWGADKTVEEATKDNEHKLTWHNAPKCKNLQGRINGDARNIDNSGEDGSKPENMVVNSMQCREKMTFRVTVARDIAVGGAGWKQEKGAGGGWAMKYNC